MELLSLSTAFYGFRISYSWDKCSLSFYTVLLVTSASVLEHFVNTLNYFGKIDKQYKEYVLWLDRCAALLATYSRYKTVEHKLQFIFKKRTLITFMLYVSLDMGFWNGKYYDFFHSIWHLLVFSLLDKNYK